MFYRKMQKSALKKILDRFTPYAIMKKCVQNTYVLVHKS
jgi:hypothetical protein